MLAALVQCAVLLCMAGLAAAATTNCTSGPVGMLGFMYKPKISIANAHGGGVIQVGDTFYLHGQVFDSNSTDFAGFAMYSSKVLPTTSWQYEGLILPKQPRGELGPSRKGERPHIIQCPATGEFVLFAHSASADYNDNKVVYATSKTVNGTYAYQGVLKNPKGQAANPSDVNVLVDGKTAYVVADGGHVYELAPDCHSWVTHKNLTKEIQGTSGSLQAPVVVKANGTFFWVGSRKTDEGFGHFYATASSMLGSWTHRGSVPVSYDSWATTSYDSQGSFIQSIVGCAATTYVFWRDWWMDATTGIRNPHNDNAAFELQPVAFSGTQMKLRSINGYETWYIDVGNGTSWTHTRELTPPPPPTPKPTPKRALPGKQCGGGKDWAGPTTCHESTCVKQSETYSKCV